MNIIAAINSKIIIVKMAMMKAMKCCSGSWSIGFGDMTMRNMETRRQRRNEREIIELAYWMIENAFYIEEKDMVESFSSGWT